MKKSNIAPEKKLLTEKEEKGTERRLAKGRAETFLIKNEAADETWSFRTRQFFSLKNHNENRHLKPSGRWLTVIITAC